MIVVTSWSRQPGDNVHQYQIVAFADTKEEVVPGATFDGMPDGTMEPGSKVITAKGEEAYLKSDGTWNWVDSKQGTNVDFNGDALVLS